MVREESDRVGGSVTFRQLGQFGVGANNSQAIGALDIAYIRTNGRLISRELIGVESLLSYLPAQWPPAHPSGRDGS